MKLPGHLPSPLTLSGLPEPEGARKSLTAVWMAPASLTPLAPPTAGPRSLPSLHEVSITVERRRIFFADKQASLLDKLQSSAANASPLQGSTLSTEQRSACVAVLTSVVAAVTAAE
jgi:hypothetical protein